MYQEWLHTMIDIIKKKKYAFSISDGDIWCPDMIEHNIDTIDDIPVKQPDI